MAQYDLFRPSKRPWNQGRIIGAKPPLKPKHIWGIRQQLKSGNRVRDLALFNCAIDAKLRGCDLVKLRVGDIAPGGALRQRATVIQQKTGRPVPFEITEPTREALSAADTEAMNGCSPADPEVATISAPANIRALSANGSR
jgi:hypothetical protein